MTVPPGTCTSATVRPYGVFRGAIEDALVVENVTLVGRQPGNILVRVLCDLGRVHVRQPAEHLIDGLDLSTIQDGKIRLSQS
jgi:hypothetical protein